MTFTKQLYEAVRAALPDITCRSFSRNFCGMSESYYSSLSAQKLPISTNALIYMAEVIECKKQLLNDMTPRRLAQLDDIQQLIANEIAGRVKDMQFENLRVRQLVIGAVAKVANSREYHPYVPPFLMA